MNSKICEDRVKRKLQKHVREYQVSSKQWSTSQHSFNIFIITLGKENVKVFHLLTQNWQPCEHGKDQILVVEGLPDIKEWNADMDEIQLQKVKVIHAGTNNENFFYNPRASQLETIKKEKQLDLLISYGISMSHQCHASMKKWMWFQVI